MSIHRRYYETIIKMPKKKFQTLFMYNKEIITMNAKAYQRIKTRKMIVMLLSCLALLNFFHSSFLLTLRHSFIRSFWLNQELKKRRHAQFRYNSSYLRWVSKNATLTLNTTQEERETEQLTLNILPTEFIYTGTRRTKQFY